MADTDLVTMLSRELDRHAAEYLRLAGEIEQSDLQLTKMHKRIVLFAELLALEGKQVQLPQQCGAAQRRGK